MNIISQAIVTGVNKKKDGIEVKLKFPDNFATPDDVVELMDMYGKKDSGSGGSEVDAQVDVSIGAVQESLPLKATREV